MGSTMNLSRGMLACSRSRLGISLTHGWHQVAHRLISRAWPSKSVSRSGWLLTSRNSRSGTALGGRVSLNRDIAPLIRLFEISASAAAGRAKAATALAKRSRRLGGECRAGYAISRLPRGLLAHIHGTEEHDCARGQAPLQPNVGRTIQSRALRGHGEDQRPHRVRSPTPRAG